MRNMRSLSRWMVSRAKGTAIVESSTRIAEAMISSRREKPRCDLTLALDFRIFISKSLTEKLAAILLHGHRSLRSVDRNRLQTGIARSASGNRQRRLTAGLRLKRHRAYSSLP